MIEQFAESAEDKMPEQTGLDTKVVSAVRPGLYTPAATTSAAIDTAGFDVAMVVLSLGVIVATGTVDVKVTECATSGGAYVDITGAVFSQKLPASNNLVFIGKIKLENPRLQFLKVVSTVGTANADVEVIVELQSRNFTVTGGGVMGAPAFDV